MFSSCAGVKTKCFPHSQRQKLFAVVVDLGFHRERLEHGLRKLCEIVTLPEGTAILEELGLLFVRHAFEFRSRPSTKDVVQLRDFACADGAPTFRLCLIDKPTLEILLSGAANDASNSSRARGGQSISMRRCMTSAVISASNFSRFNSAEIAAACVDATFAFASAAIVVESITFAPAMRASTMRDILQGLGGKLRDNKKNDV